MNIWKDFQDLFPDVPISYGEVQGLDGYGSSRVELPSVDIVVVSGDDVAIGGHVWMQSSRIIGKAPDLPSYYTDV